MSGRVRRSLALALAGLLGGLALVAALFGGDTLRELAGHRATAPTAPVPDDAPRALADPGALARRAGPSGAGRADGPNPAAPDASPRTDAPSGSPSQATSQPQSQPQSPLQSSPHSSPQRPAEPPRDARAQETGPAGQPAGRSTGADVGPRFDIVRVEPNGDAVVAGRGAPHAIVEMLVNGKPVARATADAGGQFAVVPPALPPGSSQIRLRMIGRDGRAAESEQSVAVDVAPGRDRQPLVALTAPDAATVVLSQPGAPGTGVNAAAAASPGTPTPARPARIASVDVQENGRLFVTATGAPGATLRLYLNDTLIAPGHVGPDGRASFTIGRGMKPGQYQVRIDQIDPATGKVETRAEVPLTVPEPSRMAAREPAGARAPMAQGSPRANVPGEAQPSGQAHEPAGGQSGPQSSPQSGLQASGQGGEQSRQQSGQQGGQQGGATGSVRAVPDGAGAAPRPPAQDSASRPFAAEAGDGAGVGAVYVPEISTAKITRGDNLWRISQRVYGRGNRYTVIYDANQTQIRNPDLIYPGQIFVLPEDKRG